MFQAFYTGLSGMFSFSKNLNNVSNNIANMNTPGFRGSDTFYRSLTTGGTLENGGSGIGTQVSGLGYRFSSGEIRQTGNSTDLAIAGQGMFVLKNGDQFLYTRAGQFNFNDNGVLVDSVSGLEVVSLDKNGKMQPLSINDLKLLAPEATTKLSFSGNLSSDDNVHEVKGLSVINSLGEKVEVNAKFTNNSATTVGSWNVELTDKDGNVLSNNEIRFGSDGTPATGFNSFTFNVKDSMGGTTSVTFNMGDAGKFSGSTSTAAGANSTLTGNVEDGSPITALSSISFNADGTLKLKYANGTVKDGPALALASFDNESVLQLAEGSIFKADNNSSRKIGQAGTGSLGTIVAESIELSNVDLSKEFADMIIIQRGYQASSRVLNVANTMLEQLYNSTRGR